MMGAHSIGSEEGAMVAAEAQSLYERLGGVYAIAVVVDDFIDRIMVDPRLTRTRESTRRTTASRPRVSSTTSPSRFAGRRAARRPTRGARC